MKRKLIVGGLLAGSIVLGAASPADALWCGVATKPAGKGAITEADMKPAGNSGRAVIPGGFITEGGVDYFLHGPEKVGFQNLGGLKHEQVDRGSPDHGVVHMD